jgi:hypothetical protein
MFAVDDDGHKTESAPISRMSGDAVVIDGDGYTIRVKLTGKMEMSDDGTRCVILSTCVLAWFTRISAAGSEHSCAISCCSRS